MIFYSYCIILLSVVEMATSDELHRHLSDSDLPDLLRELCPIQPSNILNFGVGLEISSRKIQEFEMRNYYNMLDLLRIVLQEALNRDPPLTRTEIVTALRDPSVREERLARQMESHCSLQHTSSSDPNLDGAISTAPCTAPMSMPHFHQLSPNRPPRSL